MTKENKAETAHDAPQTAPVPTGVVDIPGAASGSSRGIKAKNIPAPVGGKPRIGTRGLNLIFGFLANKPGGTSLSQIAENFAAQGNSSLDYTPAMVASGYCQASFVQPLGYGLVVEPIAGGEDALVRAVLPDGWTFNPTNRTFTYTAPASDNVKSG